jgi:predicted CXXCH cytochrome family protein
MKTLKYLLGATFALTMVASIPAQAQVTGSAHDLSTVTEEICVYCHTPHNGDVTSEAPLWNRTMAVTTFAMYTSPTMDMTVATDPQGVSLACLSCHDGVTAYNNIIRGTASNIGTMPALNGTTAWNSVGFDGLGNDHPISITYDPLVAGGATEFNAAAAGEVGGLPLYGAGSNQVECATCHNPHDTTNGKFLRATNVQSTLCTTCHVK